MIKGEGLDVKRLHAKLGPLLLGFNQQGLQRSNKRATTMVHDMMMSLPDCLLFATESQVKKRRCRVGGISFLK